MADRHPIRTEIVFDGVNGYVCTKDDMEAVAAKLAWLAENRDALAAMSGRARQIALSEFDLRDSLPRYAAALLGPD